MSQIRKQMVVLKFSIFITFFCGACATFSGTPKITWLNNVDGCFSVNNVVVNTSGEGYSASVNVNSEVDSTCPCKSALMQYESFQNVDTNQKESLLSGSFSVLGKDSVDIPLATQKNLVHSGTPLYLSFSCY